MLKKICVFLGSGKGFNPLYAETAAHLGEVIAEKKIKLIYGGARVGLMGILANSVLNNGGEVIGVMPKLLVDLEVAHEGLTEFHIVDSMHERKALMEHLSDGFIAMPGGLGTFEEIFETITLTQLNIHSKPCGFLNTCNFYSKLIGFIDHAVDEGFIQKENRNMIQMATTPELLLDKMNTYKHVKIDKSKWALKK